MKNNHWKTRLLGLLLASLALLGVSAAAAGTESDPLVTLSYLNDTFLPQVLQRLDARTGGGEADGFTVVTLSQGQSLYGRTGCELLLRRGGAVCVAASAPGLIDETTGGELGGGESLAVNHLYLMTVDDRGLAATADNTVLLARGTYAVY